jgi:hypothetical protein
MCMQKSSLPCDPVEPTEYGEALVPGDGDLPLAGGGFADDEEAPNRVPDEDGVVVDATNGGCFFRYSQCLPNFRHFSSFSE